LSVGEYVAVALLSLLIVVALISVSELRFGEELRINLIKQEINRMVKPSCLIGVENG